MASVVNVQDPSTLNNLAVNSSGQIGISNFPGVQTVQGTVNVAFFPAIQTVNGTVDISDRSARQLGVVTVASGTIGTNTAPAYNIIQDATSNTNKLKVNSDGSINVDLATGAALVGSMELVDSGGVNKAAISAGGALKVDNSGVTQPVSGTFWQASQPVTSPTSATGTLTSVAGAAASTQLLASNAARKGMYLFNDSTAVLYLAFAGSASTTAYTVQIPSNGFFEMPTSPVYTGAIYGIWASATGNARVTEMS